jgi:hypothetical protein
MNRQGGCHSWRKFKGHHEGIFLIFAQIYDGENVQLGDVKLTITEATIAEATGLPMAGEKYFKRVIIDKKSLSKIPQARTSRPRLDQGNPLKLHQRGILDDSYKSTEIPHLRRKVCRDLHLSFKYFITF